FQSAQAIYEKLEEPVEVAELLNRMAWLYREKDDLDSAKEHAERARAILEPMEPTIVFGYVKNMLGVIEYASGDWQKSRDILMEAVTIATTIGSDQLKKVAGTNLGNTLW